MRSWCKIGLCLMVLAAAPALALAEGDQEGNSPDCQVVSSSDLVKVVVCAPGLAKEVWQQAGKLACGTQQRCNVWIWDDVSKAPDTAPEIDTDMTEEQSRNAVAIWVNDSRQLVAISPHKQKPAK